MIVFRVESRTPRKCQLFFSIPLEPRKKPSLHSIESWLVNDGILISWLIIFNSLYNWVGFHPQQIPNKQPGALFSLLTSICSIQNLRRSPNSNKVMGEGKGGTSDHLPSCRPFGRLKKKIPAQQKSLEK